MLKATGFDEVVKNTTLYSFTMRDNQGMEHHLKALGIEEITNKCLRINLDNLSHLFPKAPKQVWKRPVGAVDILVGGDYRGLQPAGGLIRDGQAVANLRLTESRFGCGFVLSGTHEDISVQEQKLT